MKEEIKQITQYVRGEQQWICPDCDSEISCNIGRCPTCGKMYSAGDEIISAESNVRAASKHSRLYNDSNNNDVDTDTSKKEGGESVFAVVAIIIVILFVIVIALAASSGSADAEVFECFEFEAEDSLYLLCDGDSAEYTEATENNVFNISGF